MLKPWDGIRQVFTTNVKELDLMKVSTFLQQMNGYVSSDITADLKKQIFGGVIGNETEKTSGDFRGSFTKRIQSYLWKTYGFQFDDKGNLLNNFFTSATKDTISEDLFGRFDPSFNWTPGDFGDPQSCFWLGNSIARYYMKGWEKAVAYCLYTKLAEPSPRIKVRPFHKTPTQQEGTWYSGYGRCWVLFNWPNEDVLTIFNAYPSGTLLNAFVQTICAGLAKDNPKLANSLTSRQVSFTNKGSTGGWFYTNGGTSILLGTPEALKKLGTQVDMKVEQPKLESFPDYGATCMFGCGRYAWKDRPSIWGVDKANRKAVVCELCLVKKKREIIFECDLCGVECFYHPNYTAYDFCSKDIMHKINGGIKKVCPTCFEKYDEDKYSSTLPKKAYKRDKPQKQDIRFMEEIGHENFFEFAH
jgi:hypothetical protein